MTRVLMTSPEFIREVTNIGDNVNGKVLQTAIREAQDIELKQVIGCALYDKLVRLIVDEQINEQEYIAYKDLLDECQYFLAYMVVSKLCIITSYKIDNVGVVQTNDENILNASLDDIVNISSIYEKKADYYRFILQGWILNHKDAIPEIDESCCRSITSHLNNAASGGVYLGGQRGKKRRNICRC